MWDCIGTAAKEVEDAGVLGAAAKEVAGVEILGNALKPNPTAEESASSWRPVMYSSPSTAYSKTLPGT